MFIEILDKIIILSFITMIVVLPFYAYYCVKKDKEELLEMFNNINIGDKIDCRINNLTDNPFEKKYYDYTVEIIDKRINDNNIPYIKYRFEDGSERSEKLTDLLMYKI